MKTYHLNTISSEDFDGLIYRFGKDFLSVMVDTVVPIVNDVRTRGDEAVKEYTQKFDGFALNSLTVSAEEIEAGYDSLSDEQSVLPGKI